MKPNIISQAKLNHNIWMLANAIQGLSNVNESEYSLTWLEAAIEDIEDVLKDLKSEMPF